MYMSSYWLLSVFEYFVDIFSLCVIYKYLRVNLYLSDFRIAFVWSEYVCVPDQPQGLFVVSKTVSAFRMEDIKNKMTSWNKNLSQFWDFFFFKQVLMLILV